MKIALDVMGGDNAPDINVDGAKRALQDFPLIEKIYLVGREETVRSSCDRWGLSGPRVEIVPAAEVVEMNESGLLAVRKKKNSSMSISVDLGASVAAATVKLRLLDGVERAGIVTQLPNEFGVCNVTDTGANPDAKPRHLVGYAVMASILARSVYGKQMPKVGVMSNGSEDEKGTDFTKGTFCLLKHLEERGALPFKFVGNVEGHDLFEHEIDVALTDGFTGNVLLKTCEATAKAFSKWLKEELKANPFRMVGAACASGAFRAMKVRLSADSVGGSPLLGVRGVTIIAHGSSTPVAIRNALRVSMEMVQQGVNPLIEEEMARLGTIPEVAEVYPK